MEGSCAENPALFGALALNKVKCQLRVLDQATGLSRPSSGMMILVDRKY